MSLKYLVTILYRPRATMRRILEQRHRWAAQVTILAFVCASINEINVQDVASELPGLRLGPGIALLALSIIAGAIAWVVALYIMAWIATPVGRLLGGTGSVRDVRAALGWGLVPIVWSIAYRLPFTLFAHHFHEEARPDAHQFLMRFISHGGCSMVVLYLFFQLLFALWCVGVGSFTVGIAQKFSTEKGFVNVVIAIVLPFLVIGAAVFTFAR
jgi:hypothetical protein